MTEISTHTFQNALLHVCRRVIESEPMLTRLDAAIGDGDHGFGMREGFAALSQVLSSQEFLNLYDLTVAAGMTLVKAMGGASGVIFGTLFIGGRDALLSPEGRPLEAMDADAFRRFFRLSAQSVARRGRVGPNDRTMLDALVCAVTAMEAADTADLRELSKLAWEGACRGAEATKQMLPRIGRSKNFRDQALGYPDPGAVSASIIFEGLYEAISSACTKLKKEV